MKRRVIERAMIDEMSGRIRPNNSFLSKEKIERNNLRRLEVIGCY